jgi:hypothetical protein
VRLFKAILLLMLVASLVATVMVGALSVSQTREMLVRDVWEHLRKGGAGQGRAIAAAVGGHELEVFSALRLLERGGHLARGLADELAANGELFEEQGSRGRRAHTVRIIDPQVAPADLRIDWRQVRWREQHNLNLLRTMTEYAYATACRRRSSCGGRARSARDRRRTHRCSWRDRSLWCRRSR